MSTKAGTAALDPISQRLFLLQRRASRHPASGQKLQEGYRRRAGNANEMRLGSRSTRQNRRSIAICEIAGQHGPGHLWLP
jgi:hypothetical protein